MRRKRWVAPSEIDCDFNLRRLVRMMFAAAAFFGVLGVMATVQSRGGYVVLLLSAPFAALTLIGARHLHTMRVVGSSVVLSNGTTWTRDTVLAVHTSFGTGPSIMGPARHLAFGRRNSTFVRLGLWTSEAATHARRARLAQALDAGDARAPARLEMLGAPDVVLTYGAPLAVLSVARAVARALSVPWLHEGVRGREVRSPAQIELSVGERAPAGVDDAAGKVQISWRVDRPIFDHDEYSVQIVGDELVLRGLTEERVALSQVMEVEVNLGPRGALCIGLRGTSIELPVETPAGIEAARMIGMACARAARPGTPSS